MRRDLAGHGDDPFEIDLRTQAAAPQGVDQILGGHVAGRDLGERQPPRPANEVSKLVTPDSDAA
jgi:hypothetical protein